MRDTIHRIWSLVVKEFLQLSRDKILLAFVIAGPLFELFLMGSLAGGGVQNLPLAVVDLDRSQASRELVVLLDQTDELRTVAQSDSVDEARAQMQRGEVAVAVVVPPGYGEDLEDPRQGAEVQIIADGSSYIVATVAVAAGESVAAEVVRELLAHHPTGGGGALELRFLARFNTTLDNRPGAITTMLALIVYQVTLVIAAQSFTRERELGTMEQLRITPLGRLELIAGKAIPTLVVGMVDTLLTIGVVAIWFDIPLRGSLPLLLLLTVPFVLAQIGWGTLISLVSRTQQQAILFVFAMAMLEVACSGFMVPASDMPAAMRVVASASSVGHYLTILRGVMLRGAGLGSLWLPALVLSGIALIASTLAWLRLRMGLDVDSPRRSLRTAWQALQLRRRERKAGAGPKGRRGATRRRRKWTEEPA
jgi:ABC-2 type transport system permease protein